MTTSYEEDIYLTFSLTTSIGPLKFLQLKEHFQTARAAIEANEGELANVVGSFPARQIVQARARIRAWPLLDQYRKRGITIITQTNPLFPRLLLQITDPPICLFALQKDNNPQIDTGLMRFAIVGSRRYTPYGKTVTYSLASSLSQSDITIVSGLALGIDATAHQAALECNKPTVAVLGCGVDILYPPANRGLRQLMIEKGNTLLSEYPPGTEPMRGFFVARNRIVSGISRGVLIVEGSDKSGSLTTARCAADQGRDVFAVPGPITSLTSQAPLILIKQGATLVTTASDILSEYSIHEKQQSMVKSNLSPSEQQVFELIIREPQYADEVALSLSWSIVQVMNILSLMEIKGLAEKDSSGKYHVANPPYK